MLDLDGEYLALTKFGNRFEHLGCLLFKPEVGQGGFAARTVFAANLELSHDPGRRFKRRLPSFDFQAFDPAEIQVLEQLNKATLRFRQRGFTNWMIQFGTPFAKSKELPVESRGESSDCSPFLALSSQRQSNAFKKEALRPV